MNGIITNGTETISTLAVFINVCFKSLSDKYSNFFINIKTLRRKG